MMKIINHTSMNLAYLKQKTVLDLYRLMMFLKIMLLKQLNLHKVMKIIKNNYYSAKKMAHLF